MVVRKVRSCSVGSDDNSRTSFTTSTSTCSVRSSPSCSITTTSSTTTRRTNSKRFNNRTSSSCSSNDSNAEKLLSSPFSLLLSSSSNSDHNKISKQAKQIFHEKIKDSKLVLLKKEQQCLSYNYNSQKPPVVVSHYDHSDNNHNDNNNSLNHNHKMIQKKRLIPKFHDQEITVGRVLGRGGFCAVHEVSSIQLMSTTNAKTNTNINNGSYISPSEEILYDIIHHEDEANENEEEEEEEGNELKEKDGISNHNHSHDNDDCCVQDRYFMEKFHSRKHFHTNNNKSTTNYCNLFRKNRNQQQECRYAIKMIQSSCYDDNSKLMNAIVDLAIEATFLSCFDSHPNIIKLRGMSINSVYDIRSFLILDRLHCTLNKRFIQWKNHKQQQHGRLLIQKIFSFTNKKDGISEEDAFWLERCSYAYDIADALNFLHESNVMYRDVKPENIGFDIRGDIKIFDFGLAKEFDPMKRDANRCFHFTADTGTPLYMDPQIALGKPYNELCDVYSFCILFWQMLELEKPFQGYTMKLLQKHVMQGGHRPLVNDQWPAKIQQMLRSGWGKDYTKRPSMKIICETIRQEINNYHLGL